MVYTLAMRVEHRFSTDNAVTLYHGDCIDFLKTIPDESASLVVTSPPYNIGKEYEKRTTVERYVDSQAQVIAEAVRILKPEGSICWEVGNFVNKGEIIPIDILLYPIFVANGCRLRNRIVWHFGHGLHCSKRFSGRYETIVWFTKTDEYYFNLDPIRVPQKYPQKKYFKGAHKGEFSSNPLGKNPSDVWDIPNVKSNHIEKTIHPCQFPVELVERLVLSMTRPGELVVDPYIGVGSTAIAALMHERRAAGSDLSADYLQIAKERVLLAEKGKLLVRPMDRPVYDPSGNGDYIPPKEVRLGIPKQLSLMEKESKYKRGGH